MIRDKLNLALIAGIAIALCGILMYSLAIPVKAQLSPSAAIEIRDQLYTTAVTTITFPTGAPSTTISTPTNGVDSQVQTFSATPGSAKPVVTLVNTAAVPYKVWYNIITFTNGVVTSEAYIINAKGVALADATAIVNAVTFDANTLTAGPTVIAASGELDLYLKVVLGTATANSGTSTLTIIGEP